MLLVVREIPSYQGDGHRILKHVINEKQSQISKTPFVENASPGGGKTSSLLTSCVVSGDLFLSSARSTYT